MAETPQSTGRLTTEWATVRRADVIGGAMQVVGLAMSILVALPQTKWVAIASIVCGTILQIATKLGYQSSRTAVKVAEAEAKGQAAAATVTEGNAAATLNEVMNNP